LLPQLRERLEKEVNDCSPQAAKVKVIVPANPIERRFSVWIGATPLLLYLLFPTTFTTALPTQPSLPAVHECGLPPSEQHIPANMLCVARLNVMAVASRI